MDDITGINEHFNAVIKDRMQAVKKWTGTGVILGEFQSLYSSADIIARILGTLTTTFQKEN
jgi:hypothetical protein